MGYVQDPMCHLTNVLLGHGITPDRQRPAQGLHTQMGVGVPRGLHSAHKTRIFVFVLI
jgi:hypothetical protein